MAIVNYINFGVISIPDPNNPTKQQLTVQPGGHALFAGGVVMDIAIGVDAITAKALNEQGAVVPALIQVKALLDTGCTITSIDSSVVKILNLTVRGYNQTQTANGPLTVQQHFISLAFTGTKLAGKSVHQVQTANLAGQPFQMLVGRDLMASWNIVYNGTTGTVSISD